MVEDKPQSAKILEETAEVVTKKASDYSHAWATVGVLKRVMSSPNEPQVIELTPNSGFASKSLTGYDSGKEYYLCSIPTDMLEAGETTEVVVLHDTPQKTSTFEENADGIITRLLDKVIRSWNLIFMKDEPDVENESTEDAAVDIAGYGAMLGSLIRREGK